MVNNDRGLGGLVCALAALLLACEPYCPKGYDKRGDTCYRIRDSGVEGGLSDGEAESDVAESGSEHSAKDGALGEDSSRDGGRDEEERSCADAASGADCGANEMPDPCEPTPCEHGGTCLRTGEGMRCDCTGTGHDGVKCEVDIDECAAPNSCTSADYPCVQTEPPGYTCQGQFADWPMPDAVTDAKVKPSYAVTADPAVIIDQITGLVWQRYLPASYAGCTGVDENAGDSCWWQEAKAYCRDLVLGGANDWRLPSKIELESIVDDTRSSPPALDNVVFPDVPADANGSFWSSSRLTTATQELAVAVMHNGGSWAAPLEAAASPGLRVRCVRGPRVASGTPTARYQVSQEGVAAVTDTRTGLTWQQNIDADSYTRSGAIDYCGGLGAAWRLPTKKELLTLIDPVRLLEARSLQGQGAIDLSVFPSTPASVEFWSISPRAIQEAGEPRYWLVHSGGIPAASFDSRLARVRCVR